MRAALVLFLALCAGLSTLAGPVPAHAMKDSFPGETRLVRALGPEDRLAYFGTQYLMNQYQKRAYLTQPTAERRAEWMDRFWIDLDPTPATPENERREEHDRRVALARRLFGMKDAPGWDKRGETLIRYGLPTNRTKTFGEVGFYDVTPPGEIWYYKTFDMIVQFSDYNLKGEYIYWVDPGGRNSRREIDRNQTLSGLMKYGVMEEYYLTQYMTPDELKDIADFNPDDIDYVADPTTRMLALKDRIAEIEKEKVQKEIANFFTTIEKRPVVYSFEVNQHPLPLFFDVVSFRGGERTLRTDVNFEVPASELQFVQRGGAATAEVEFRAVVRDMDDREIAAGVDTIRPTMTGDRFTGASLLPGQVTFALAPGYYRVGLEARDLISKRRAGYHTNVELAPYREWPAVSDIQFASSITETSESRRFQKGNLQVVPHPIHAYRLPNPLSIYFEIYGLDTDKDGLAWYKVEYKIVPLEKRRKGPVLVETPSVISSDFETSGYGAMQPQRISVAPANLWEGPFRFIVTVTDRRTFRTTTKSEDFSILK